MNRPSNNDVGELKEDVYCCSLPNESSALNILTDPDAAEPEWLAACDELSKESVATKKTTKKNLLLISLTALVLIFSAVIGSASYFHVGPFEQKQEINFGPYMEVLEKQIKSKWHPPTDQEAIVKMHFKVHPNGEISDVGFERMSRLSETDAAAIKAIVDAMPALPPLPGGFNDTMDISFTFEVNHKDKIKSN